MNFLLKSLGLIILFAGLALVLKPNFFSTSAANSDGYETIEKRVLWGALLGIGFFLLFFSSWYSWKMICIGLLIALTLGVITARVIGTVIDGLYVKQLFWLLIELMILIILCFLYSMRSEN